MGTRTENSNPENSFPAATAVEPSPPQDNPEQPEAPSDGEEQSSAPVPLAEEVTAVQPSTGTPAQPDSHNTAEAADHEERPPHVDDEPVGLAAVEAELVAEVVEEVWEEIVEPSGTGWQGELPDLLMRIVDARISVWQKLLEMDARRAEMEKLARAREIRDELSRQNREIKNNPNAEVLQRALERQQQLLREPVIKSQVPPPDPKARTPDVDQNQLYRNVIQMGLGQIALLLHRRKLDDSVPTAAVTAIADEPLVLLCRNHGLNADQLMGWTYYALGVQKRIDEFASAEKEHRAKLAEARAEDKESNRGFGGLFRGASKENQVGELSPAVRAGLQAASREMQAIEPQLTEMFWRLYEDVAWLLVQGHLDEEEIVVARSFLRYGLVSVHPGLIQPEKVDFIIEDCQEDVYQWQNHPQSTHLVYADEYIEAVASKNLTVSPDENLELNERGSNLWKADRVWRQAVICRVRSDLFNARLAELKALIERKQAEIEKKLEEAKVLRETPKKVQQAKDLEKQVMMIKPAIARLRHATEHMEARIIPKVQDQADEAADRLGEAAKVFTEEMLVRREARFIRYMARLVGRLKEPFAQFVLRDHFKPNGPDHNSRRVVLEAIEKLESEDRRLFHHVLMPNKRLDRQITVRMSPTFLLPPGRGQMGLAVSPRKWDDNGRIVLPLLAAKAGDLEKLLVNVMADFRWDCSKEDAGMDWIVADALCAAYASARWNVRKLPEKAQKMMGFDFKLKERGNFRIHYALYVNSAHQGGRLLFSRTDDVYKVMVKYIGLPPGVQMLKRD